MIISLYSTKGGVGKSTTILSLANAIACENGKSATPKSVCIIDADHKQESIAGFFENRKERGLADHSIECLVVEPNDDTPELMLELAEKYDHVIIDLPGKHEDFVTLAALQADLILVPTSLNMVEVNPATRSLRHLMEIIEKHDLETRVGVVLSRGSKLYQFEGKTAKAIMRTIQQSGYPIMRGLLSNQSSAMSDAWATGYYHFEYLELEPQAKSSKNAHSDALKLWDACQHHKLIEVPEGEEEVSEVANG